MTRQIYRWRPAAWLRVAGPDAFAFLQGQFTNDLRALPSTSAVYGLWLNQKGKVVADSFVLPGTMKDEFWVGSYFSPGELIMARLESYLIADDVVIEDQTDRWWGTTIQAADAKIVAQEWAGYDEEGGRSFPGRRGLGEHWECVTSQRPAIADELTLSEPEVTRARVRAGIPAVPQDIGPGELPNEGGLEVDAVSYVKGCYLGQEVMARLKSMGKVRRQLLRVRGVGSPPANPATLFQGERKVGELRSVVAEDDGFVGLALLTTLQLGRNAGLQLVPGGPDVATLMNEEQHERA